MKCISSVYQSTSSARPLPLASDREPRAETEDEPRAPLIRCSCCLVDLHALACLLVSFFPAPSALPPLVARRSGCWLELHHKILRGNSTLWGPRWDPAQPSCFPNRLVGSSGRGGVGLAQTLVLLGVTTHPAFRLLSSGIGKAPRCDVLDSSSSGSCSAVYNSAKYSTYCRVHTI